MIELPDSIRSTIADQAAAQDGVRQRLLGFLEGQRLATDSAYRLVVTAAHLEMAEVPAASNGAHS